MKTRNLGIGLVSLLLLTGCGRRENPASDASSSLSSDPVSSSKDNNKPSSSSSHSEEMKPEHSIKGIKDYLETVGAWSNYTLDFGPEKLHVTQMMTENYVYFESTDSGYITLGAYRDDLNTQSILYRYTMDDNGNVILGGAVSKQDSSGNTKFVESISDINYFDLFSHSDMFDWEKDQTLVQQDIAKEEYYSENTYMVVILAAAIGYYDYASENYITKVTFDFDEDGYLTYQLYWAKDLEGAAAVLAGKPVENGSGRISHVLSTSVDALDIFRNHFKFPTTGLDETASTLLTGKNIHATSSIKTVDDSDTEREVIKTDNRFSDDKFSMTTDALDTGFRYSSFYKKGEDGYPYEVGINANNQVESLKMGTTWDYLVLPSKVTETKGFLKEEDGHYHYYGFRGDDLLYAYTRQNFSESDLVATVDAYTDESGKINRLVFVTVKDVYLKNDKVRYYRYQITVNLNDDVTFSDPVPFSASPIHDKVVNSLSYLDGTKAYRAICKESDDTLNENGDIYWVSDSVILHQSNNTDKNKKKTAQYSGYKIINNQVVPFDINQNKDGTFKAVASGYAKEGDKLTNYVNFSISPDLFHSETIEGKEIYATGDFTINLYKGMLTADFGSIMIGSTLRMYPAADGKISKITYQWQDVLGNRGNSEVDLSYTDTDIPNDLKTAIDALTPKKTTPETWEDEKNSSVLGTYEIYDDIVAFLGAESAAKLPYYYDAEISGHFQSDKETHNETQYLCIGSRWYTLYDSDSGTYSTKFPTEYESYLKTLGFKRDGVDDMNNKRYTKDDIDFYISIGSDCREAIYLSKKTAD